MIAEVTEGNFEQEVIKSPVPAVVDFWAPWCKPCQMINSLTEKLAADYEGKVRFCKLNVDQNPRLAARYGVMNIPFLYFSEKESQLVRLSGR